MNFTKYGELIDSGIDPIKTPVYRLITAYFKNPKLAKLKDVGNYSMYVSKNDASAGLEFRYLIAFTSSDSEPVGNVEFLENLNWVSLQTRNLKEDYQVPIYAYIPTRLPGLDKKIDLIKKDDRQYTYTTQELPLYITLIPNATQSVEYQKSGSVVQAIETYNTILTWK